MICRLGDQRLAGRTVSLDAGLDPERVAAAVRTGADRTGDPAIAVEAPDAGPLHERVGCIYPAVSIRPRTALAVAARSRGWSTDLDDEMASVRAALDDTHAGDVPDGTGVRRRLAETEADVERLRERVAAARGRADGDLEAAVRSLSEAETNLAAVRERRASRRERARNERDRLETTLERRDRLGNLERRARRRLVDRASDRYVDALSAVPGVTDTADPFAAPADAMALAIARVGRLEAPVVVATGRFASARRAAAWLDAPVLHLEA